MMNGSKCNCLWIPNSTWLAGTALHINRVKMNLSYAQAIIPPNYTITANNVIADTGSTSYYIQDSCQSLCTDNQKTTTGPKFRAADGNTMTTTHSVNIPRSTQLSKSATHGHVLDHLIFFTHLHCPALWQWLRWHFHQISLPHHQRWSHHHQRHQK